LAVLEGVMLETLGRWIPGFDPATGILAVPPWVAAVGAALLALIGLFVLIRCLIGLANYMLVLSRHLRSLEPRAGRLGPIAVVGRLALVLLGAALVWLIFEGWSKSELTVERRALDARTFEFAMRALTPGSALACLDAGAGDTVEASCEAALFATPEATATAVSYVAAQLALLADGSNLARRDRSYAAELVNVRRAMTSDRFGIVAHVLAVRHGCTPDECRAFTLLDDASRVKSNLVERTYEFYVVRHAAGWPPIAKPPVATTPPPVAAVAPPVAAPPGAVSMAPDAVAPPPTSARASAALPPAATGPGIKPPGPNVFFPSSASIPPVSIMNAEPPAQSPEGQTPAAAAKPSTPTPPRRPAPPAPTSQ
jgi:hypothetical protein